MDPPSPGDQGEVSQPQPLDWRFAQVFGERAAGEDVQEGTYVRARARGLEIRAICGVLWGRAVPVGRPGAVGIGWGLGGGTGVVRSREIWSRRKCAPLIRPRWWRDPSMLSRTKGVALD